MARYASDSSRKSQNQKCSTLLLPTSALCYQQNNIACTAEASPTSRNTVQDCISTNKNSCLCLKVRLWNLQSGTCDVTLSGHKGQVTALKYNQQGGLLASGAQDTDIIVWDVAAESGLYRLRGHQDQVTDLVCCIDTSGIARTFNYICVAAECMTNSQQQCDSFRQQHLQVNTEVAMTMWSSLSRHSPMGLHGHLLAHVMLDSQCMFDDQYVMKVIGCVHALHAWLDSPHSHST